MKRNKGKTKEQLISELAEMRQRIAEFEALEAKHKHLEDLVKERVAELEKTNNDFKQEIAGHKQAEEALRASPLPLLYLRRG